MVTKFKTLLLFASLLCSSAVAEDGLGIFTVYMQDFKPARVRVVTPEKEKVGGGVGKMVVLHARMNGIHDPMLLAATRPGSTLYGICMEPDQPAKVGSTYTYAVQDADLGPLYWKSGMGYTRRKRMEQLLDTPYFSSFADAGALYEFGSNEQLTALQAFVYEASHEPDYNTPIGFDNGEVLVTPMNGMDLGPYREAMLKVRRTSGDRKSYVFSHERAQDFFVYTTRGYYGHGRAPGGRATVSVPEPSTALLLSAGLLMFGLARRVKR